MAKEDFYTIEQSTTPVTNPEVTGPSVNTSCYGTGGFWQYCFNRLPCGICTRTNMMCPMGPSNSNPYPEVPTITWSNGTKVIENPYVTTGETVGGINNGK